MEQSISNLRVALAHDYLVKNGGAERVLQTLHNIFPKAPVYTLVYDEEKTGGVYKNWDIRTSYLQHKTLINKWMDYYRASMPQAVESFDLSEYDLVISDPSSFIKGIITQPHTSHISYMHSPTRFLWWGIDSHIHRGRFLNFTKKIIPYILHKVRQWDFVAAQRPDLIIANSETTRARISKFYRRDSVVINPPVNTDRFDIKYRNPQDYFLIVSRLEPHKDIDIAIEAAMHADVKLKIAGTGGDLSRLKLMSDKHIEFLGNVSDDEIAGLMYGALAFIAPQVEDFGITMVEALAAGCPVIAKSEGGAVEIVQEGCGILIKDLDEASMATTLREFRTIKYSVTKCCKAAERFSINIFREKLLVFIDKALKEAAN